MPANTSRYRLTKVRRMLVLPPSPSSRVSGRASAKIATALQGNRPKPSWRISASNVFVDAPPRGTPPRSQLYLPATRWVIAMISTTTAATPSAANTTHTPPRAPGCSVLAPSGRSGGMSRPTPASLSGPVPSAMTTSGAFGVSP